MEKIAWVEILDRHGNVSSRRPVYAWPLKIGRAYTNDLVLDDPYADASHLEIHPAENGSYTTINPGNASGLCKPNRPEQTHASITPEDVVKIGLTRLRIRPLDYAVAATKPIPRTSGLHNWGWLVLGVLLFASSLLLASLLDFDNSENYSPIFRSFSLGMLFVLAWGSIWSLISRVHIGRANYVAHFAIAYLGFGLTIYLFNISGFAGFMLDAGWMKSAVTWLMIPVFVAFLYQHFKIVSHISHSKLLVICTIVTCGLSAMLYLNDKMDVDNSKDNMPYLSTVGPPSILLVKGITKKDFIHRLSALKVETEE